MLGTYVLSSVYYDAYYSKAQKDRALVKRDYQKAFASCDAILTPTSPSVAFKIGEKSNDPLAMYLNDVYTVSANLAGIPGISVPSGLSDSGLPIVIQLLGNFWGEEEIFRLAARYQSEFPLSKKPTVHASNS
jgi:aspartyl-tRNA(Asn)/glutamyl-tRNA(Gln) amidotransferase subunit A